MVQRYNLILKKDKDTRSICNDNPSVTWVRYKSAKFTLLTFCQNCIFLTREFCIFIRDTKKSNYAKDLRLKFGYLSDQQTNRSVFLVRIFRANRN